MKNLIVTIALFLSLTSFGQPEESTLVSLLNSVSGGTWVSQNKDNTGQPGDFKFFYMQFSNWADHESVQGDIYGVKNNGDTTQLMEVWNFIDKANKNIFLVQRTAWGETSIGTIQPYKGKHLDIQFKSTTAQGQEYYTRDIHYLEGPNTMKAITYHKQKESEDWKKAGESNWSRQLN